MTKGQRIGYFLSEWTIGWLLFFVLSGLILWTENHWLGVLYGLLAGALCCSPSWLVKVVRVRGSLRRYPFARIQ
jgi:hypothetical protein